MPDDRNEGVGSRDRHPTRVDSVPDGHSGEIRCWAESPQATFRSIRMGVSTLDLREKRGQWIAISNVIAQNDKAGSLSTALPS